MTAHPGLARGFCKLDKANQELRWKELANMLNDAGPPIKDIFSWKKAWTDWKSTIRKKLHRKKVDDCSSDGESEDKYGLTKIESSINLICDLENQIKKRNGEFAYDISNAFHSPTSSPKLSPQSDKKNKCTNLRESFLEALSRNSINDSSCDVQIKEEKKTDEFFDETSNYNPSNDSSSKLTATTPERKIDTNISETIPQSSKSLQDEKVKSPLQNLEKNLNDIDQKLVELGKKYDTIIALKMEQLEELKRDRKERRRHNLEIEKHNSEFLAIKSRKKIKSEIVQD